MSHARYLLLGCTLALAALGGRGACAQAPAGPRAAAPADVLAALRDSLDAGYWRTRLRPLTAVPLDRYRPADHDLIGELLALAPAAATPDLFRLAGALGLRGALRRAGEVLALTPDLQEVRRLALVRAGDPRLGEHFVARVTSWPVDESFVREVLPLIAYARRREAVDYLWAQLMVDNPGCRSPDPDATAPTECGYRLLEALAPITEDFPVAADWDGGLATADYAAALRLARDWYRAHADTYTLDANRL